MAFTGADYSSARPGGAALRAAGVYGVMRYLGTPTDGRQIELGEFQDLNAHAVWTGFVRETGATGMLAGHGQGVYDAQVSVANLARLGLSNQVVYAAADFDVQASQFAALDAYMQGFASVIGLSRTGIYGGMFYINHCRQAGLAPWMWKAAASSWDHGQGGAVHLEQTTRTPPVAGSDHNYIYNANYGQAGMSSSAPVTEGEEDMPSIVTVSDWGATFIAVPGKYILHITGPSPADPHLVAAQALAGKTSTIDAAHAQALLDECLMGNFSAAQLKACVPGGHLRCTALDQPIPAATLSDAQVKTVADQISGEVTAGATEAEVQTIVNTALAGLKLGTIK